MENEQRKIRLLMEIDITYMNYPYYVDYMLAETTKVAAPCQMKIPTCANRYIDVILQPGEAELVHFFRGEFGCDSNYVQIDSLTITPINPNTVRLNWERITATDLEEPFQVENYYICGSHLFAGPYTPIAADTALSYVDSVFYSAYDKYFYQVQACGHIQYRSQSKPPKVTAVSVKK